MATSAPPPVALKRLEQIAADVCGSVLDSVETYEHSKTGQWNQTIIEKLLKAVTQEAAKPYKLAINSTIVQHSAPSASSSSLSDTDAAATTAEGGSAAETKKKASLGRRGMHSATGGYWNETTDGMWSYKYEAGDRGFDVVIMLIWIGI